MLSRCRPRLFASPSQVMFSSTSSDDGGFFRRTVYVHPLSQIILEYFQDSRSDWINQKCLERSLVIHRDGSFELNFPITSSTKTTPAVPADNDSDNDSNNDDINHNKIWTSYDEQDKRHWLSVEKGLLHERFLLQDNLASAWHANRRSLPERIHNTVEEMIGAVDRMESLEQRQAQAKFPK